jgi:hypothetical protein
VILGDEPRCPPFALPAWAPTREGGADGELWQHARDAALWLPAQEIQVRSRGEDQGVNVLYGIDAQTVSAAIPTIYNGASVAAR